MILVLTAYHLTSSYGFFVSENDCLKTFLCEMAFQFHCSGYVSNVYLDKRYFSSVPESTASNKKNN